MNMSLHQDDADPLGHVLDFGMADMRRYGTNDTCAWTPNKDFSNILCRKMVRGCLSLATVGSEINVVRAWLRYSG